MSLIRTSCFLCLHYGTRNLTKIWCKFDMVVTFNVKRVPVFRFITIRSRDCNSFKSIVRDTKIPCHLLKVETGFNRRADLVRPHSELRAHKPYDCGIASNQRWRSFLEF